MLGLKAIIKKPRSAPPMNNIIVDELPLLLTGLDVASFPVILTTSTAMLTGIRIGKSRAMIAKTAVPMV
ncbi:hypothetical protein SFSGTM_26960 [Sulfuriferula nivalis]|uniref:Uncharacterized protein n=1 Tax=Sulfuriferula nivalis TaxID=2675298 RepID=A0A809S4N5_9PROT|nr:hypothetical protein SFSGTM_26960 [Sulfuriferula nivalis]